MNELVAQVERAKRGDLAAYGDIVRGFQNMAYGCAYVVLNDFHEAEDVAQDAFVEAYRRLSDLREPKAFPGWFRRIVLSQCHRVTRKRKVPTVPIDDAVGVRTSETSPDAEAQRMDMKEKVLAAVQSLPEGQRMATTLFYISGYSQSEVADFLEVPVGTVKKRLHDSRRKLKERMVDMVAETLQSHSLHPRFAEVVVQMNFVTGRINRLRDSMKHLDGEGMAAKTRELRKRLAAGESRESITAEAFSLVREACRRALGQPHYDIQLVASLMLDEGWVAEKSAGEGKSITCLPAAYMAVIRGLHVDIVTVNDYLAGRDAAVAGKVLSPLGVDVRAITRDMSDAERAAAYGADITYGTAFRFLADHVAAESGQAASTRRLDVAIIDEIDSVLIDDGATPVSVPSDAPAPVRGCEDADAIASEIIRRAPARTTGPTRYYQLESRPACDLLLTEAGKSLCSALAVEMGLADVTHERVHQALRARLLYEKNREYIVEEGRVIVLDKETGRPRAGQRWSEGLHQALECKERVEIRPESVTRSTMRIGDYFRLYGKLAGLTGSAMPQEREFEALYGLKVASVPTRRPLNRMDHEDRLYRDDRGRWEGIVDEVDHYSRKLRRPVLIGVPTIKDCEEVARLLRERLEIEPQVLNALPEHASREGDVVTSAGCLRRSGDGALTGVVTVATPMAGRGTDIKVAREAICADCTVPGGGELLSLGVVQQKAFPPGAVKCCLFCDEYDEDTGCSHCFKPKRAAAYPNKGRTQCRREVPCGLHVIGVGHTSRRADAQLRARSARQGEPGSTRFLVSMEDKRVAETGSGGEISATSGPVTEGAHVTRMMARIQKAAEERESEIRIACVRERAPLLRRSASEGRLR